MFWVSFSSWHSPPAKVSFVCLKKTKTKTWWRPQWIPASRLVRWWDFPGGPVAKTVLLMQGGWVWFLLRELDSIESNERSPPTATKTQGSKKKKKRLVRWNWIDLKGLGNRSGNAVPYKGTPPCYCSIQSLLTWADDLYWLGPEHRSGEAR